MLSPPPRPPAFPVVSPPRNHRQPPMLSSARVFSALRSSGARPPTQPPGLVILRPFSSSAAPSTSSGEEAVRSSDRGLAAFAAGIVAVVGSSLGIWLLPSPASDSFASFVHADSALGQGFSRRPEVAVSDDGVGDKKTKYLFSDSYRKRVFFNYEKRIRLQSPPEKIFEYFASFRNPEGEVFMTAADLMRAVVPVFPPSESNHVREGHLRGECHPGELHCPPSKFFLLFDTDDDGLISFPEYIFFVTLLSIPESSFTVAFKMFDVDASGDVELEEFKKVMGLMRSSNRQGNNHSGGLRIGLKVGKSVEDGGLLRYFFGKDGNERLQHDKFVQFLRDLHSEIVRLEFTHYDYKCKGSISAKDFALSMIASADIEHINKLLSRVDELDSHEHLRDIRITFEEFKAFAELRNSLQPLMLAIFSYGRINGLLTKSDFQRAASNVCGVSLSDNVIDVIFHVFDANRDGNLSSQEFLRALQRRMGDHQELTGSTGLLKCCLSCARNSFVR